MYGKFQLQCESVQVRKVKHYQSRYGTILYLCMKRYENLNSRPVLIQKINLQSYIRGREGVIAYYLILNLLIS